MNNHIKRIYLGELIKQAKHATHCANLMDQCEKHSTEDFFREAEHFIQHAAAISQLLWPSGSEAKKRAKYLRTELGITDDNILKNSALRNHIVHFDERLDTWANNSKGHNFVDQNIGVMIIGLDQTNYLRNYNPQNYEYTFLNEVFNLKKIQSAIEEMYHAVKTHIIVNK